MAVNAAGKTLCSVDFEVFGKVQGKYVCKYLFGLFSAFYQLRYDFRALNFCSVLFLLQLRSIDLFPLFFVSGVFFRKVINIYIYSALAQLYLWIKVNVLHNLAKAWEVEMRVSKGVHFWPFLIAQCSHVPVVFPSLGWTTKYRVIHFHIID